MSTFWNERYGNEEFAYGTEPNEFFAEQLDKLTPGKLLLPAEGEGRNAVYAASKGWEVTAFDSSEEGRKKALKLAQNKNVSINYILEDLTSFSFQPAHFDVIGLIYVHQPESIRKKFHQDLITCLKPEGKIILEAFTPSQIGRNSGGPQTSERLYTKDILDKDFKSLSQLLIWDEEVELDEGKYHSGRASVIRMIGVK